MYYLLLLICIVPFYDDKIVINVNNIELNHLYGDDGKHILDQIIFWKGFTDGDKIIYHVVGWQLLSNCRKTDDKAKEEWDRQESKKKEELRLPYNPEFIGHIYLPVLKNQVYESRILDYTIRAESYHISDTQYDPEIYDRTIFPIEARHEFLNTPSARNHEKYRRFSTKKLK